MPPIAPKNVPANPFMSPHGSNLHYDTYNSDVSDGPGVAVPAPAEPALEENTMSVLLFDANGRALGVLNSATLLVAYDSIDTPGKGSDWFTPYCRYQVRGDHIIQAGYMSCAAGGVVLAPTSHGHILLLDANRPGDMAELADFDIAGALTLLLAQDGVDKRFYPRLNAALYDYAGNLWFSTGDLRAVPSEPGAATPPPSVIGYVDGEYARGVAAGEADAADLDGHIWYFLLENDGEVFENGLAADEKRIVALSNQACYSFSPPRDGRPLRYDWRTPYPSAGLKGYHGPDDHENGGLAWGSGTTVSLSSRYAIFANNAVPVGVTALDKRTGDVAAIHPFLTTDPAARVSVDNSILVYGPTPERTAAVVANTYGMYDTAFRFDPDQPDMKNAGIFAGGYPESPDNSCIRPGLERIDFVDDNGQTRAESVWQRPDIAETAVAQLCTATGLVYVYACGADGVWSILALDFATGDTAFAAPVGVGAPYQNRGMGMFIDATRPRVYIPTMGAGVRMIRDASTL